jgi:hypothetical protein
MPKHNNNNKTRRHRRGRRSSSTRRRGGGIASTVSVPLREAIGALKNVGTTGANVVIKVPTKAWKAVGNLGKGAFVNVANGANSIVRSTANHLNSALSFKSKSRRGRRASRKSRRAGRR